MPVADPRAGRLFVWLISCFILLSLAAGGALLGMYMTQPDSTTSAWLLYAGMSLVCLPWFFWFMLCIYRCISRSLGFRIVCGSCGGDEAGSSSRAGAGGVGSTTMNRAGSLVGGLGVNGNAGTGNMENADGRHVHFGAAVVVNEGSGNNSDPRSIASRSSSSGSSNNDMSFKSHESEIPLASAMAT